MSRGRFTDENIMDWVRRREAGEPLRAIAGDYGVSTQYVAQMTNRRQQGPWPTAGERPKFELDDLVDRINGWLRERSTATIDEVKEEFDLTAHQWNQIWKRLDNTKLVGRLKSTSRVEKYDDDSFKAALWQAYEANGRQPLTGAAYERLRDRNRHPSLPTLHNRFGGWSAACRAAGVPFGGTRTPLENPSTRSWSNWSDDKILEWVRAYRESLGPTDRPSYNGYDNWQRSQKGAPSGSLIRTRLKHVGNWSDILAAAFAEVATDGPDAVPVADSGELPVRATGLIDILTGDEGVSGAAIAGLFDAVAADVHEFVGWPVDPSRCLYCGEAQGAAGHPRRCLRCGSVELQRIVYGMPAPGYRDNAPPDVWFGGCCRDPFEANVRCASCRTMLRDEDGTLHLADEFESEWYADLSRVLEEFGHGQIDGGPRVAR